MLVSFSCVCPVIDNEFCHNIVKVAADPRLKNRVNHSIKASKKAYYHSYFEDNAGKAKPTWNGINTLLLRKKNFAQPTKLIIGEAAITDPHELSNAFNRHFTDIGPNRPISIF